MRRPNMILFDYGHTLLHEPDFDLLRGCQALFAHVTANPDGVGAEEFHAFGQTLFQGADACRQLGYESHEWPLLRTQCEYFGLELDVPYPEAERILWDAASPGAPMPHVEGMLAFLRASGIPSGVISNIGWSGQALSARVRRLLPEHEFSFVLASSEYGIRKPDRRSSSWPCGRRDSRRMRSDTTAIPFRQTYTAHRAQGLFPSSMTARRSRGTGLRMARPCRSLSACTSAAGGR